MLGKKLIEHGQEGLFFVCSESSKGKGRELNIQSCGSGFNKMAFDKKLNWLFCILFFNRIYLFSKNIFLLQKPNNFFKFLKHLNIEKQFACTLLDEQLCDQ